MTGETGQSVPDAPRRRAPLLVTAELPGDILAWADGLRRAHYPPERNRLRAHVTLFHALPPSAEGELCRLMTAITRRAPPAARIDGLMDLGKGTALLVDCPEVVALHEDMAERLHGIVAQQDAHTLRLHITVQNKVTREAARALQRELAASLTPRSFTFHGLGLYAWEEGLWRSIRDFPFRQR